MPEQKSNLTQTPAKVKISPKIARKKPAAASGASAPRADAAAADALVRVYRQGLGDCILVRLRKQDGSYYKILIDCGVAVATTDAVATMNKVAQDVLETSGGEIDVLAVTHQHWDHVSGFLQAENVFSKLSVGEVWVAWTEDEKDDLAQKLKNEHGQALKQLTLCAQSLAASGAEDRSEAISHILGLSGDATGKTGAAFAKAKTMGKQPSSPIYCRPSDPPVILKDPDARIFVLGPPHDEKAIRKTLPSKAHPEIYELAAALPEGVISALQQTDGDGGQPFAENVTIPFRYAQNLPFFRDRYFAASGEQWRRIDTEWLNASEDLALALQSATNNTSLVLAIELANKKVLLFAADAQVGNWESWQNLIWDFEGRRITGPDLLARTVLYKVGHHGSHNATLKEQGLEEMSALVFAIVPVDEDVARKMRWSAMPFKPLLAALSEKVKLLLRTDQSPSANLESVTVNDLYFEITMN